MDNILDHLRALLVPRPEDTPSDGRLLERFARCRDEACFAALVRRHGGLVLGVCRRVLRDEADAEDAFQATFLVLAKKAASIRNRESVASWLYGVAYRVAARARVDAGRRRTCEREAAPRHPGDPLAEVVWRELRPILDEELNRLPEKYRAPVVLCYLQSQSHAEAARQLGWPRGTVAGRLARARQLLRVRLTRRGLTLPGGLLGAALAESASAAVPAALATNTVKAAALVAAGQAAAGLVPAAAAALVEGVLKAMLIAKLKIAASVVLALAVLGSGATWFAHQALAQPATGLPAEKAKDSDEVARLKEEIARLKKQLAATKRELATVRREAKAQADRAQAERDRARASAEEARRLAEQARKREDDARRAAEAAYKKAVEAVKQIKKQKAEAAEVLKRFAEQNLLQKKKAEAEQKKAEDAAKKAEAERKKKQRE
jgi:RNA polymerase sigma factor (sigma-70 family)